MDATKEIRIRLFSLREESYRHFQARLLPELAPASILGVRIPHIRALAKELAGSAQAKEFCSDLPHTYYEENCLHAALLEHIGDADRALLELEAFLPYLDNWATCDSFCPKVLRKHPELLLSRIRVWLQAAHPYTVRFALVRLTAWYLGEPLFSPDILELAASVDREEYYIRMAQAWFFSMALIKQKEHTLPYFEEPRLPLWVHNKALTKARESLSCTKEDSELFARLKIKLHTERRPT